MIKFLVTVLTWVFIVVVAEVFYGLVVYSIAVDGCRQELKDKLEKRYVEVQLLKEEIKLERDKMYNLNTSTFYEISNEVDVLKISKVWYIEGVGDEVTFIKGEMSLDYWYPMERAYHWLKELF